MPLQIFFTRPPLPFSEAVFSCYDTVSDRDRESEDALDLFICFSYLFRVQKFISQKIVPLMRSKVPADRLLYLTILSNVFLGFALGRIIRTPAEELIGSTLIKVLLIVGACFLSSYVLSTRKAAKGVTCCPSGKLRPALKELRLCAAANAFIFLLSMSLFFLKSQLF